MNIEQVKIDKLIQWQKIVECPECHTERFVRKDSRSVVCKSCSSRKANASALVVIRAKTKHNPCRVGNIGKLFFTVPRLRLEQTETQLNAGGLTDIYLDLGTYVKSFYSVMYAPSCIKIKKMGVINKRLHHMVKWQNAIPEIVSCNVKKAA